MGNKSVINLITRGTGIALVNLCVCAATLANDLQGGSSINVDGEEYKGQRVVTGEDVYGAGLALVQAKAGASLNVVNSTFENNYAKSNNTANGTYGVAVSATGANEVAMDAAKFNSNQVESVSQTQGVVYISGSENVSIKNSEFVSNKAGVEGGTSYSAGGALSLWGNKAALVEKTNFEGTQTNGDDWADGGALYARGATWGGYEPSSLLVKDSSFSNNTLQSATSSRGGALFLKSDGNSNTLEGEIVDSAFTGNKSITLDAENAYGDQGGGAIYNESSKLKITANKNITNVGNSVVVGGNSDDSRGGFLYMYSGDSGNGAPSTEFAVAENATLTIGDGTAGQDSIASNDSNSSITKTGAGTLTVNSSMAHYKGALKVAEGVMNSNNGLSSENINVASGATLNSDKGTWIGIESQASWSNIEYYPTPIAEVSAGGSLNLSNATLKDNSFIHNGSLASGVGSKGAIWVNGGSLSVSDSLISGTESVTNPGDKDSWNSTPNAQGGAILFNGATSSGTFSNVEISNNSASAMSVQGGAVAAFGGNYKIENGTSFAGNKAVGLEGATSSISGGAIYATDSWSDGNIILDISDASFTGNSAEGKISNAGAIIYESYNEGSGLTVKDTVFAGNSSKAETRAEGGALRIFTTSSAEKTVFNDVVFTGNTVEVASPEDTLRNGGGAIYANASDLVFNVSKDASFSGNSVAVGGEKSDYYGGFLRLASYNGEGSSSEFNVSGGATLTIGDGTAGQDSIASTDSNSSITKTGAGTLTVNGSMKDFTGTLSVTEGTMDINNGLGATKTLVDNSSANISGASLSGQNYVSKGEYGSRLALVEARNNAHLTISDSTYSNNSAEYNLSDVNGVYGSVVSSTESSTSIKNTVFEGNTNSTTAQVQGIVYLSGGDMEIESSIFKGNEGNGGVNATGAAVSTYGGELIISGTTFDGNVANSDAMARGGALYGDNYAQSQNGTIITVSDSVFINNKAVSQNDAWGGAAQISFANADNGSLTFKDTVFANNTVEATAASGNAFGGAVGSRRADVTFEVSEGKHIVNTGNLAIVNGAASDANGGFLYMHNDTAFQEGGSRSTATFNIASNASMTIGNGADGYDSIASSDSNAAISKLGAGTLTVNSSMEYFTGSLSVNEGVMSVNNKLGASGIAIASGATLGLKIGGENVLSNASLTSENFSNQGTLVLSARAGVLSGDYNISAGGISDYGNVKAYGGSVVGGVFKASEAKPLYIDIPGDPVTVVNNGRVALTDGFTPDVKIEMAFNSASATVNSVNTTTDSLKQAIGSDFSAIGAYAFDAVMDSGDTVVLSFLVGDSALKASDFTVYHKSSGGTWEKADNIDNIEYDGEYLSFIVSHFSEYGYAAVPEPAALAVVLGALALCFAVSRRRAGR